MHEITLSQRALEIIEQQAQQADARRVIGVWLKVGAGVRTAYRRTTG